MLALLCLFGYNCYCTPLRDGRQPPEMQSQSIYGIPPFTSGLLGSHLLYGEDSQTKWIPRIERPHRTVTQRRSTGVWMVEDQELGANKPERTVNSRAEGF